MSHKSEKSTEPVFVPDRVLTGRWGLQTSRVCGDSTVADGPRSSGTGRTLPGSSLSNRPKGRVGHPESLRSRGSVCQRTLVRLNPEH